MTSINLRLFNSLQTVKCPGDFYTSGKVDIFLPRLEVNGVGSIALPLLDVQAKQLIAISEQAPYGRGQETLVDTHVRRTWQINADQINLTGKHWQKTLDNILTACKTGLGVSSEVQPELYKMLIYDTGSFFINHRDTEKTPGMFATLVIVLPSNYSGGELIIKHQQKEAKLDLHCEDISECAYAAFYADCVHEVLPITAGCRLTLIYNLNRTNKKLPLPKPPDYRQEQETVTALLHQWTNSLTLENAANIPEKLVYPLHHAYSEAELGFDALKNADAALADVLVAACEQSDCDIHLALVSIEENGYAEYTGSYGRRRGRYYDDEENQDGYEIGEVLERYETISEWQRVDGTPAPLPTLPFTANEFCPPEAFASIEFSDLEFQEATGNAGASFDRAYHCAALIIWPKSHYIAILNQAGLAATMPALKDLCHRWQAEGKDRNSSLWQDAHTLSGYMLRDNLPREFSSPHSTYLREFLICLHELSDEQNIARLWILMTEADFNNQDNCAALIKATTLLPWQEVINGLQKIMIISAAKYQTACAALLAGFCKENPTQTNALSTVGHALFKALPGDHNRFPDLKPWQHATIKVNSSLVVNALLSFSAIDAKLAETALDYMLTWSLTYVIDGVLLPSALQLIEINRHLPVVERLREAVVRHLQERVAMALEAPTDWRRDSQISCACRDCKELRDFLNNPANVIWQFKAAEARRDHIESIIKHNQCDITRKTERLSRPYSLVCTKNQASYQKRVEQRTQDLAHLAKLAL